HDDCATSPPDRLASRILGMGDIETLIEKAEAAFEEEEAEEAAARLLDGTFTFDDFLDQMQQLKKMGSLTSVLGMMPGLGKQLKDVEISDREIGRIEAMIRSMTPAERIDPDLIDASRRQRIAVGSGTQPGEVKGLVDRFKQTRTMLKGFGGSGTKNTRPARGAKTRGAKGKKGRKGRGRGGGRTTPKGSARVPRVPLSLPGLETGELPGLN
ncbi:MAG: signal recognition particle protein, partial [Acidimicrobiales bacterium]